MTRSKVLLPGTRGTDQAYDLAAFEGEVDTTAGAW